MLPRQEVEQQSIKRLKAVPVLAVIVGLGWSLLLYVSLPRRTLEVPAKPLAVTGKREVLRLFPDSKVIETVPLKDLANQHAAAAAAAAKPARNAVGVSRTRKPAIVYKEWTPQTKFPSTKLVDEMMWNKDYSDVPPGECRRRDGHSRILDKMTVWGGATRLKPRLFCGIYTYHKNHDTNLRAIKETWGSRCDGFVAFSDQTDESIPTFAIEHEGEESYQNMWQKVRSMWKYIYYWYKDEYDWFLMGGDDIFIVVENLRKYLLSYEFDKGDTPFYLGMRFKLPMKEKGTVFNSGGASYLLNIHALKALVDHLDDGRCMPHFKQFAEDVLVARCLKVAGVLPHDTRDELGEERFHPLHPYQHLQYRIPPRVKDWYANYAFDVKEGAQCCSKDSISWHYIDPKLMRRIFHLMYSCKLT